MSNIYYRVHFFMVSEIYGNSNRDIPGCPVLGMDDTIHKEVMNRESYSSDDIGDSMVSGWKIVKEIIEFLAFILIFILTISLGTIITIGVVGVVFFLYVWDTSKYFWKNIKNT